MGQYELYSFQPVGQWMDYLFPDLGAEGCCRSLNALLCLDIDGLVQERRNASALAVEWRLSCTNPSIYDPCVSSYFTSPIAIFTRGPFGLRVLLPNTLDCHIP